MQKQFKFVDQEREAEIDTLLSKIQSTNATAKSSIMQDAQQEIFVRPQDADPHEQLNDLISELISQLTHFDDNLKLKLHLNLELNQQD